MVSWHGPWSSVHLTDSGGSSSPACFAPLSGWQTKTAQTQFYADSSHILCYSWFLHSTRFPEVTTQHNIPAVFHCWDCPLSCMHLPSFSLPMAKVSFASSKDILLVCITFLQVVLSILPFGFKVWSFSWFTTWQFIPVQGLQTNNLLC